MSFKRIAFVVIAAASVFVSGGVVGAEWASSPVQRQPVTDHCIETIHKAHDDGFAFGEATCYVRVIGDIASGRLIVNSQENK